MAFSRRKRSTRSRSVSRSHAGARRSPRRRVSARRAPARRRGSVRGGHSHTVRIVVEHSPADGAAQPSLPEPAPKRGKKARF